MQSFNIDFLTNHLPKKSARTHRTLQSIVSEMRRVLNSIVLKSSKFSMRKAFMKLVLFRKKKVQRVKVFEEILHYKLHEAFFSVLRYSLLSHPQQLCKINEKLNYPISVLQRKMNVKRSEMIRWGWRVLKNNQKNWAIIRKQLNKVEDIFNEYIKRNLYAGGFRAMVANMAKPKQYRCHLKNFQYVFESARVRVLFDIFTMLSLKTAQKHIIGLDKSKVQKREIAVKNYSKRSEIINQLKRKINNLKGQVSQGQILNNKKRVDGAKQNGGKLIKKNEEMRIYQIGIAGLDYQIEKMQQQLTRKQNVVKSRNGNAISFEQLQNLYSEINYNIAESHLKKQLAGKLIDNMMLKSFRQSQNYIILQNIKLKHLMALYEGVPDGKKNDSYLNADNENNSLKLLLGSIIKHELIEHERKEIETNIVEIESHLIGLQDERQKSTREIKKLKALASK